MAAAAAAAMEEEETAAGRACRPKEGDSLLSASSREQSSATDVSD